LLQKYKLLPAPSWPCARQHLSSSVLCLTAKSSLGRACGWRWTEAIETASDQPGYPDGSDRGPHTSRNLAPLWQDEEGRS
jgi:hypothetical protein